MTNNRAIASRVPRVLLLRHGIAPWPRTLIQAHTLYKAALSPFLHTVGITGSCRFQPTCSEYSTLAIAQHGLVRGFWLSLTRLLRCHPFTRGGWDPVPPRADGIDSSR